MFSLMRLRHLTGTVLHFGTAKDGGKFNRTAVADFRAAALVHGPASRPADLYARALRDGGLTAIIAGIAQCVCLSLGMTRTCWSRSIIGGSAVESLSHRRLAKPLPVMAEGYA